MSKTLQKLTATRKWISYIDDERSTGNSIIVTLQKGWEFADDPNCGVQGFDNVSHAELGTRKDCVKWVKVYL